LNSIKKKSQIIMKNERKCTKKNKKRCNRITNLWITLEMKDIDFEKKENKKESIRRKKS